MKAWVGCVVGSFLLVQGVVAHALPVTIGDPYLVSPNNCGSPSCDVIGLQADFDIEKIVFTSLASDKVTAEVWVNYHAGDTSLSPWTDFGLNLQVGDLIFQSGGNQYAVPLHSHGAFTAGELYSVSDFYTAREALNNPLNVIYRPDAIVQIQEGTLIASGGSVSVACTTGNSSDHCGGTNELIATVTFAPGGTSFWSDLSAAGMSVHFASATCGNDIADGILAPVPEPGTLLLLGSAVAGLGLFSRGRFRRGKLPRA